MIKTARTLAETNEGRLRLWHHSRYKTYQGVEFEDRTLGDILEEFYTGVAVEVDQLSSHRANLSVEELERLGDLEEVLEEPDRTSLRGLSTEESEAVYMTAHKTGDPLADYWEYRASRDLPVDLDLTEVPPRSEWDKAD